LLRSRPPIRVRVRVRVIVDVGGVGKFETRELETSREGDGDMRPDTTGL